MGLLALLFNYQYSAYYIIQTLIGAEDASFGLRLFGVTFFSIALLLYFKASVESKKLYTGDVKYVFFSIIICILFYYTSVKYGGASDELKGSFLAFGVRAIPSVIFALTLAKCKDGIKQIEKWLLPFAVIFSVGLLLIILNPRETDISEMTLAKYSVNGMNYQQLSYFSAYALVWVFYVRNAWQHIEIKMRGFRGKIWSIITYLLQFLLLYCQLAGGGRGAVVVTFVVGCYIVFSWSGQNFKKEKLLYFILVIAFSISIFSLISKDELISDGVKRITMFLNGEMKDKNRMGLRNIAIRFWEYKPIMGWGVGSIWYTVGYYSHNFFTDLLCEVGLVGLGVFLVILFRAWICVSKLIKIDCSYRIIVVFFMCSFIGLQASGYYLNESSFWFTLTYVLVRYEIVMAEQQEMIESENVL